MMNFTQKRVQLAAISALLVFIISHPQMYRLTNRLPVVGKKLTKSKCDSCPTDLGLAVHSLVFFLFVVYAMPTVKKFIA